MNKIIVIGTIHSEVGACTSDELIKIIQEISPSVIFCEAAPEIFPAMLKATDSFNTPEIKALRAIIENRSIDIIPVDLHEDPFDGRLEAMQELFRKNYYEYFCATEIQFGETYQKGFLYLNSEDCDQIHKDKNSMEKSFVASINHYELSQLHMDWLQWNDRRESHWINAIHDYFKNENISIAIFLVGSAHRIRLIEKIKNLGNRRDSIPIWDFYPFK